MLALLLLLLHDFRSQQRQAAKEAKQRTVRSRLRGRGTFFSDRTISKSSSEKSKQKERRHEDLSQKTQVVYDGHRPRGRHTLEIVLVCIYYFLVFAMVAMMSLEIARQATARIGIGLLPFNLVGALGAFACHVLITSRTSRSVAGSFWLLFAIFMAIKVATYAEESQQGFTRAQAVDNAPLNMYKVSDQITDDATMVGVALALFVLEVVGLVGLR